MAKGYGVSSRDDEKVQKVMMVTMAQPHSDTKSHWVVHFACVDDVVCELHLNNSIV